MNGRILIIEDDKDIGHLLAEVLEKQGYQTDWAGDGITGLKLAVSNEYSLILLDLMLPLKTGEEVLRTLRRTSKVPVIVLSAKNAVYSRIELLRLGADDYVTKPFDIDEVVLRVEAVLRRLLPGAVEKQNLYYRDITLDDEAKRVYVSGKEVILTAMEYAILELMVENPTKIFSKARLFEAVSGVDYLSGDNTIHVHISNIRKKLKSVSEEDYIETVYGMGYRLINE